MDKATQEAMADQAFDMFDAWENGRDHADTVAVGGWVADVCEDCHGSGQGPREYCGDGCCSWSYPCQYCTNGFQNARKS